MSTCPAPSAADDPSKPLQARCATMCHRVSRDLKSDQPLPSGRGSAFERLVAAGRIVPPRLDRIALGPPLDRPLEKAISEALVEQRQEP